MLVLSMAYLGRKYQIPHRLAITIHDEVRFLVPVAEQYRAAFALQIANLWTRAMFAYRLEMTDLPLVNYTVFVFLNFVSVRRLLLSRRFRQGPAKGAHLELPHTLKPDTSPAWIYLGHLPVVGEASQAVAPITVSP